MSYDLSLFKGTAKYYAKYRPGYSQDVFKLLVKKYKLNGKGKPLQVRKQEKWTHTKSSNTRSRRKNPSG